MVEVRIIFEFRYKQIGRKIAYYRKLRNFTQDELAQKINISKSSLGKIECGHYNHSISLSILMAIADGLKIDLDLLLKVDKREESMELEWEHHKIKPSKAEEKKVQICPK